MSKILGALSALALVFALSGTAVAQEGDAYDDSYCSSLSNGQTVTLHAKAFEDAYYSDTMQDYELSMFVKGCGRVYMSSNQSFQCRKGADVTANGIFSNYDQRLGMPGWYLKISSISCA